MDWDTFQPKKGNRKRCNVADCLYWGYICVPTAKCTEWFVKDEIMNVEVERNVETDFSLVGGLGYVSAKKR